MGAQPVFPLPRIHQVCVVVADLQEAMESYSRVFGLGPWRVYEFGPESFKDATYRGRPAKCCFRAALTKVNDFMYEIIQPTQGESLFAEFLARHGPGMQHIGILVENIDDAVEPLRAAGYDVLFSGRGWGPDGDGAFAYMGTDGDLSAVFEFVQPTRREPEPDAIYPPDTCEESLL